MNGHRQAERRRNDNNRPLLVDAAERNKLCVHADQNGQRRDHHDAQTEALHEAVEPGAVARERIGRHAAEHDLDRDRTDRDEHGIAQCTEKLAAFDDGGEIADIKIRRREQTAAEICRVLERHVDQHIDRQDIDQDDDSAQDIFPCVFLPCLMRLLLKRLLHQYCTSLFRK